MSSAQDSYLQAAAETARRAAEGAKRTAAIDAFPSALRPAVVTARAGDVYTVDLIGADGEVCQTIAGVTAWGGQGYELGQQVFVVYIGTRPIPFIVGGGGGSGGGGGVLALANRFFSS
jgi:hypothetical protein